jgi:beta-phosphoglucomutase-like phosphatase (HAD superfamily)
MLRTFTPGALVFDMDGLLVDSEPLWFEVERAFASSRGGIWTPELARACVGKGLASTLTVMHRELGLEVEPARDTSLVVDSFVARVAELKLKAGGPELLAYAHGKVPLALASSSSSRLIDAVLTRFDIAHLFRNVVSGESVPCPKPAPDIFLRTADLLGIPPTRCLVLEDSIAGVRAARAARMSVVAVPEENPWDASFEAAADAVVGDLFRARDLLDLGT